MSFSSEAVSLAGATYSKELEFSICNFFRGMAFPNVVDRDPIRLWVSTSSGR